jgi:hypothetical protein
MIREQLSARFLIRLCDEFLILALAGLRPEPLLLRLVRLLACGYARSTLAVRRSGMIRGS